MFVAKHFDSANCVDRVSISNGSCDVLRLAVGRCRACHVLKYHRPGLSCRRHSLLSIESLALAVWKSLHLDNPFCFDEDRIEMVIEKIN